MRFSLLALVCFSALAPCAASQPKTQAPLIERYNHLPLRFEKNHGQVDPAVKFVTHGAKYTVGLTSDSALLWLPSRAASGELVIVRMQLLGASHNGRIRGEKLQSGETSYLVGSANAWHTSIPNYSRVRYSSVYPGIDLLYYGNRQHLEYDFAVSPGGDPHQLRFKVEGASKLQIAASGDLVISTSSGPLVWRKPIAYQPADGARIPVDASYRLLSGNIVAFEVGSYDKTHSLIIDPTLAYAGTGGPLDSAAGYGPYIKVDASGAAYIMGTTINPQYPVTAGAFHVRGPVLPTPSRPNGHAALFVTKIAPNGFDYVYSTFISGSPSKCSHPKNINGYILGSIGLAFTIDGIGDVYAAGYTDDQDFPTSPGAYQRSLGDPCAENAMVAKLNPQGSGLVYSTYLGGNMGDEAWALAVDAGGNAYIAGDAGSPNFPTTAGAFQTACVLDPNTGFCYGGFVSKLNPSGSKLIYSTYFGSPTKATATLVTGVAVDSSGSAYIGGPTFATDLPVVNAFQSSAHGADEGFVGKLNPTGTAFDYLTYLGGTNDDQVQAIAVDAAGSAYVTGYTASTDFPVKNAFQPHLGGNDSFHLNVILTKLSPDGATLEYSTYLGGSLNSSAYSIALDSANQAYVTGSNFASDFPVTPNALRKTHLGGSFSPNTFFSVLGNTGSTLTYSTNYGTSNSTGYGVALDRAGNAYISGAESAPLTCKSKYCFKPGTYVAYWAKFKMP